jgi:hypothetical protein
MPPLPGRGRRAFYLLAGAVGVALVVLGPVTAAYAEDPTPTPSAGAGGGADPNLGPATPGEAVCTVANNALNEITGMVATDKGIYVVEGGDTEQPTQVKIYTLNAKDCKASVKSFAQDPVDPEDLALGSDGFLWVADIGDNGEGGPSRERIAFEKVNPSGGTPVIYRVVYPNKGQFHATAMLLDKDDVPIIFTQGNGKSAIYTPAKALVANAVANLPQLKKVGDFTPQKTGTSNGAGAVGNSLVTGAAKSADGKKVVIRTRSDAYEFAVGDDGDIVKAITETDPVVTPLPDEPQGEAITYSADGSKFLTLSTKPEEATENPKLLSYTPHVPVATDPNASADPNENVAEEPGAGQTWLDKLTFSELTRIVAAVGVVGLVLAVAGVIGIRRARRRRREEDEYDDYDDYEDEPPPRRGRGRDPDRGYAPRDPQYSEYGQYADSSYGASGGYADNGYGSNGYATSGYGQSQAAGYGQPQAADGNGYAAAGYGGGQAGQAGQTGQTGQAGYAGYSDGAAYGQYGADQYGQQQQQQQQYAGYDPYGQPQYGGQYGGEQNYGTAGYGAQAQGYGQQYGEGGYTGYEDDFDPLHDPRGRR